MSERNSGFTLIEFLVVIAIFAVIIAMATPAILSSREAARRNTCSHHLREIWIGVQSYQDFHRSLPAGVTAERNLIPPREDGEFRSWVLPLLGDLKQPLLAEKFTDQVTLTSDTGRTLRHYQIPMMLCPSDDAPPRGTSTGAPAQSNYAGCHDSRATAIADGNTGLLTLNQRFSLNEIPDGSAYTILLGELRRSPDDLGWASGTRGTLRNAGTPINRTLDGFRSQQDAKPLDDPFSDSEVDEIRNRELGIETPIDFEENTDGENPPRKSNRTPPVVLSADDPGGFGSYHPGGCLFAMGDGRQSFLSESINLQVLQRLANREDGEEVKPNQF